MTEIYTELVLSYAAGDYWAVQTEPTDLERLIKSNISACLSATAIATANVVYFGPLGFSSSTRKPFFTRMPKLPQGNAVAKVCACVNC